MSIQSEITRISNAKKSIRTAIINKGVAVPDDVLIDGMSALIDDIESYKTVLGSTQPTDMNSGDIWYKIKT